MGERYCTIDNIDVAVDEILGEFSAATIRAMRLGVDETGRDMVKRTKGEKDGTAYQAPIDGGKWMSQGFPPHRPGGTFLKAIALKRRGAGERHQAVWYVKAPEYRLTHLLAKGHHLFIWGRDAHKRTAQNWWLARARDRAAAELVPNIVKRMPK